MIAFIILMFPPGGTLVYNCNSLQELPETGLPYLKQSGLNVRTICELVAQNQQCVDGAALHSECRCNNTAFDTSPQIRLYAAQDNKKTGLNNRLFDNG